MKYSRKRLAVPKELCSFAADNQNSIINLTNCSKKNERNDEENNQMPSGSMTFEHSRQTGSGLSLRADREDCILLFSVFFEA